MVPEGKYRKPPMQTPAPIGTRPGEIVPCNLDRGRCFPGLGPEKWYLVIWIEEGVSLD